MLDFITLLPLNIVFDGIVSDAKIFSLIKCIRVITAAKTFDIRAINTAIQVLMKN